MSPAFFEEINQLSVFFNPSGSIYYPLGFLKIKVSFFFLQQSKKFCIYCCFNSSGKERDLEIMEIKLKNSFLKEGDSSTVNGGRLKAPDQINSPAYPPLKEWDCASSQLFNDHRIESIQRQKIFTCERAVMVPFDESKTIDHLADLVSECKRVNFYFIMQINDKLYAARRKIEEITHRIPNNYHEDQEYWSDSEDLNLIDLGYPCSNEYLD